MILATGPLVETDHLPSPVASGERSFASVAESLTLEQMEAEHIRRVLASTPGIEEAATKLGIDPSTLYRKRKRYGI